jgi:HEPN superfamily AbiU2-like protein
MIDPEIEFKRELDVFGREVEEAIQSFYIPRTVHTVARTNRQLYGFLDRHAAFWNAALHALEVNSLIVLARIFDKDTRSHRIDRVLQLAQTHARIFSKAALAKRKRQQIPNADEWLDSFLRDVYIPTARDFKKLQQYVNTRRVLFDRNYKDVRNKALAHKDRSNLTATFAKTSMRELEQILHFLYRLHHALLGLFDNGFKPNLRPARYSAKSILKLDPALHRNFPEAEWITRETDKLLKFLVGLDPTKRKC